jgi:hypothetical protein
MRVITADLDRDGLPDILTFNSDLTITVLLNRSH